MHWNELLSHARLIQNVNHYQIPKRKKFKSVWFLCIFTFHQMSIEETFEVHKKFKVILTRSCAIFPLNKFVLIIWRFLSFFLLFCLFVWIVRLGGIAQVQYGLIFHFVWCRVRNILQRHRLQYFWSQNSTISLWPAGNCSDRICSSHSWSSDVTTPTSESPQYEIYL